MTDYYVYIVTNNESDYYKVGYSTQPFTRLGVLQSGNPFKLIILNNFKILTGTRKDALIFEKSLRDHFLDNIASKSSANNEWIKIPYRTKEFINDFVLDFVNNSSIDVEVI